MGIQEFDQDASGAAAAGDTPERKPRRSATPAAVDGGIALPRTRSRDRPGLRVKFRGGLPRTLRGRLFVGAAIVAAAGGLAGAGYLGRQSLLRDEHFTIESSSSIQIEGNSHLTRAQLITVFGEDIERNIFSIPLAERRAELEQLPWIKHATVMRLLPNRLRVAIVERTPVAFVRQGSQIGLVDQNGVLLDLDDDSGAGGMPPHYSFPVVTGIAAADPPSVRAARMKIFKRFIEDLDSSNEKISANLSDVDLSNPEDVKALLLEPKDILVHFGDKDFLERYRRFEEQMPNWRQQYPNLASADMRYERQVVLEMKAGTAVPLGTPLNASVANPDIPPDAAKVPGVPRPAGPAQRPPVARSNKSDAAKTPVKTARIPTHKLSSDALSAMSQPHFPTDDKPSPLHGVPAKPAKQ